MIKRFPFHHLSLRHQSIQNHKNFDVVICGGGLIGSSIAYNLSYLGYNNVLIINTHSVDKVRLWKSSGIVSHLHSNALERSLVKDSTQFYKKLHNDGIDIGYLKCGSLNLARSFDRLTLYKRIQDNLDTINVKSHILTPSILKKEADYLNTTDLKGALMIEEDCLIESFKLKKYYYTKFMEKNVTLVENTNVVKIIQQPDKTFTLFTNTGSYNSKALVNCAGLNARNIGMSSQPKVYIPSYPCSHHTLISKYNFESDRMPIIRDFDGGIHIQFRPKDSYIKMGGYELFGEPILPEKGNNVNMYNLKPEWNKFNSMLHEFLFRIPFLSNQKADHLTNYAESFSPDGKFVFGESLEVPKYYVIAGLCARGLQSSYDLGHQMAHLIVNGFTPKCMDFFDVKRFIKLHNNKNYLIKRISEATSLSTTIMYWNTESSHLITCRNIRSSVISPRLVDYAVFGQTNAYERPLYFKIQPADNEKDEIDIITNNQKNMNEEVSLFKKPIWFKNVEREYWACRKNAGILDMSSYSKAEISSENEEALNLLQYICSNDVDKPVGSVVHTGMLNEFGGYENDCSIVRLGKYRFLMISPTIQQRRSYYWIKRHIKPNSLVKDVDLTSMYTVLNIVGPHSQELLQSITETSLDVVNFPSMTSKFINILYANDVIAIRMTHSGEDGFLLYVPNEYGLYTYDTICNAGKNFGLINIGFYALRSLRIEKFFPYWGIDILSNMTPLECGKDQRVCYEKSNFIGKEALLSQKRKGASRRLVNFEMRDCDINKDWWITGGEPIYLNGNHVGNVTSSAYGFSVNNIVLIGNVDFAVTPFETPQKAIDSSTFKIKVNNQWFTAKASLYSRFIKPVEDIID